MSKDYVPSEHNKRGFNCPNPECGAYSHRQWHPFIGGFVNQRPEAGHFNGWFPSISIAKCVKCGSSYIWVGGPLVFPQSYSAPVPSLNIPEAIKGDYEEAQSIFPKSPRGAAPLLHFANQKLTIELGENGEDLDAAIGNLVKQGLPTRIQKAMD